MRDFSKISPALWQSKRFNTLPSDDGRYLYLYLLTNEHQTNAGAYRLPDGYATNDLRWDLPRYVKARQELVDADLILFDEAESVVMITRWFKHNAPMSDSHFIGIMRTLEKLPSHMIVEAASQAANEAWESVQTQKLAKASKSGNASQSALNGQQRAIPDRFQTSYLGKGQQ